MWPRFDHLCLLLISFLFCLTTTSGNEIDDHEHFSNDWAVRIRGGRDVANQVAQELGYSNVRPLEGIKDTYMMSKSEVPLRSKRDAADHTRELVNDPRVDFADQQQIKRRVKREETLSLVERLLGRRTCDDGQFIDPMWKFQWYMCDRRTQANLPIIDLNVAGAWKYGVTGKDVVLSFLDDGLEWNHTDIYANYDPAASWDVNDNDPDPFPRYDVTNMNKHGTRCAGEVAMMANNTKCGVGVAYNSKVGGVRLLDGIITDSVEATALGFNCSHIDIYSSSWGPTDNGETLDGPGRLASEAIERCIREGRGGKGVIYVWASGNGGTKEDNCNCDGYTSSLYTVSIGSVSQSGGFPWYGELCASTIAASYSGGAYSDQKINTIDLHDQCTNDHTGTSAAAPLGAGIIALMLEANTNLTWRDVQHVIVFTSEYGPLKNNPGWQFNAIGLPYNLRFGFGLMNAETAVDAALKWVNVPEKVICKVLPTTTIQNLKLKSSSSIEVMFNATPCVGDGAHKVNYMEHVQVVYTLQYTRRGAVQVDLFSPNGTQSTLMNPRYNDKSGLGFRNWTLTTMHMWGEDPNGMWKFVVSDKTSETNSGSLEAAVLVIHGTTMKPHHMTDEFRFRNERTRSLTKADREKAAKYNDERSLSWSENLKTVVDRYMG